MNDVTLPILLRKITFDTKSVFVDNVPFGERLVANFRLGFKRDFWVDVKSYFLKSVVSSLDARNTENQHRKRSVQIANAAQSTQTQDHVRKTVGHLVKRHVNFRRDTRRNQTRN